MAEPLFGKTWKLNPKESVFTASFKPQSETRLYEEIPGGYRLTVKGSSGGKDYTWHYTALNDGKPHKVEGRADVDAITAYRLNDRTTIGFFTKNGRDIGMYRRTVAADGQNLTVYTAGRDLKGRPYFDEIRYGA